MFEPIQNPYIVGNPIKGTKMFFGRDDDFAYMRAKFAAPTEGGLIVLCGARRSGKTSMLFQIRDGRLGGEFLAVLIDMQSMAIKDDEEFLSRIVELICDCYPEAKALRKSGDSDDSTPYSAFVSFLKRVATQLGQRQVILTFDEYELVESHIETGVLSEQVLHMFANLIEYGSLKVIFTGSDNLEGRNKPYWDAFLSKALHRRISFLSPGDTLRLIAEPVANLLEYGGQVPETIATLTAGQPFYTQVVCQSVVDHLNESRKRAVSLEDLKVVVEDVVENPLPQMIFHWNAFAPLEKVVMAIVAAIDRQRGAGATAAGIVSYARSEGIGYVLDEQAVNKALESLFHGDMLSKSDASAAFSFKMGLWQHWIARMHSVWQVIDEFEQDEVDLSGSGMVRADKGAKRRRNLVIFAGVGVATIAAILGMQTLNRSHPGTAPTTQLVAPGAVPIQNAAVVTIASTPQDADVYVDHVIVGKSPYSGLLPAGSVTVEVRKGGFRPHTESVVLVADSTQKFSFGLVELQGGISIASDPAGASIYLNGELLEQPTPDTLMFPVSERPTVELSLRGYRPRSFPDVSLRADSIVPLSHSFERLTAPLAVRSNPMGNVFVDGKAHGDTPQIVPALSHGTHTLEVRREGYKDWKATVSIPYPDNQIAVDLVMLPPGYIVIGVEPFVDIIRVDGVVARRDAQYFAGAHAAGPVAIEFVRGAVTQRLDNTVASGETLRVNFKFR